jgi:hypothetical protein
MVKAGAEPFNSWHKLRDWIAGTALFGATAAVVLWQNAHVAVLFDLSYVLNTAARIAAGQVPYRDFPLPHAPLTFLTQAAIIRLTGRVFFHHVLYVAFTGGLATVITWRIAFAALRERLAAAWIIALLLAVPLVFLGIYCIVPTPEYDCDCAFWILVALWAVVRVESVSHPSRENSDVVPVNTPDFTHTKAGHPERSLANSLRQTESKDLHPSRRWIRGFAAGILACVPVFCKQNMGVPFLAAVIGAVLLVLAFKWFKREQNPADWREARALFALLAGICAAVIASLLILHWTARVDTYIYWTFRFAAERRLPAFGLMIDVFRDPALLWTLPCVAVALTFLWLPHRSRSFIARRVRPGSLWPRIAAFALLAAPFLFTLASLLMYDDADERGDALLALWPLLILLAAALAIVNLIRLPRTPSLRSSLPLILLAAIAGTFMSQQLWGSTYAIWPLLVLLAAELLAFLNGFAAAASARWFVPALAALASVTLLVCGAFYTASEERLSYAYLPDGPAQHSTFPQLAGLSTPGPYLPEIDELLRYAQANIPWNDGIVLMPGEVPFYFATGREARFPLLFFDPTIDPYSPAETASLVRSRNIRWLIVKTDLQTKEDPTPNRAATMQLLMQEFTLAAHLRGYDVYRAKTAE